MRLLAVCMIMPSVTAVVIIVGITVAMPGMVMLVIIGTVMMTPCSFCRSMCMTIIQAELWLNGRVVDVEAVQAVLNLHGEIHPALSAGLALEIEI